MTVALAVFEFSKREDGFDRVGDAAGSGPEPQAFV
jgi:hypothetical protein